MSYKDELWALFRTHATHQMLADGLDTCQCMNEVTTDPSLANFNLLYSDDFLDLDQGPNLKMQLGQLPPITQLYKEAFERHMDGMLHQELQPNWFDEFQKRLIDTYLSEKDDFSELVAFLYATTDKQLIGDVSMEEMQFRVEFAANFLMLLKEQGRIDAS